MPPWGDRIADRDCRFRRMHDDFVLLLRPARYHADGHATDKLWLMLTHRFGS
ncbi:MAG: hypothetical protein OXU77_01505 [Gammaproteobacteria bacterium]|nr:hypothetical protein [Gammaproteobacteria bacterium]